MKFDIRIEYDRLYRYYSIERTFLSKTYEYFKVTCKNKLKGNDYYLKSNRPLFRNKKLMHRRPDYTIVGKPSLPYSVGLMVTEIQKQVDEGKEATLLGLSKY